MGVTPAGDGFRIPKEDLDHFAVAPSSLAPVVREFITGRDLLNRQERQRIIDFFGYSEDEARTEFGLLYQWIVDRVKPERELNKRKAYRERWWIFAEPRPAMRLAVTGLARYIATVRVSKFKVFQFLETVVLADSGIICVAIDDAWVLGMLSSRIHLLYALAASGTLEDRPYWNNSVAFDPFPFPAVQETEKRRIRELGEQLDAHRKRQQSLHPDLTITGMYNVLEKLRSGETLTAREKTIHEQGLVSVLRQIHDDLDAAVFDAYGWPHDLTDEEILERLVALNAERAEEEKRGLIRWLRPEFQNPAGTTAATQKELDIERDDDVAATKKRKGAKEKPAHLAAWPDTLPAQIGAVRDVVTASHDHVTTDTVARAFKGAKKKELTSVLDSLAALGIVLAYDAPDGRRWRRVGV